MGTTTRDISWQKANELLDVEIDKVEAVEAVEVAGSYVAVDAVQEALGSAGAALERGAVLLAEADKEFEENQLDEVTWQAYYRRAIQLADDSEGDKRAADALQVILDGDLLG